MDFSKVKIAIVGFENTDEMEEYAVDILYNQFIKQGLTVHKFAYDSNSSQEELKLKIKELYEDYIYIIPSPSFPQDLVGEAIISKKEED